MWGIHRSPVNSPRKWPVTRKMFPLDDVIMARPVVTSPTWWNRANGAQRWWYPPIGCLSGFIHTPDVWEIHHRTSNLVWNCHLWCEGYIYIYMLNLRVQHSLLTKIFTFNMDMFVEGTYSSYQYTSIGNCALVYHTICDLIKSSIFILSQVHNNNF